MAYKKINVELIVFADEAESVVAELNAALDRLEEHHTIFGGGIETVPVDHTETRKEIRAQAHRGRRRDSGRCPPAGAREGDRRHQKRSSDLVLRDGAGGSPFASHK